MRVNVGVEGGSCNVGLGGIFPDAGSDMCNQPPPALISVGSQLWMRLSKLWDNSSWNHPCGRSIDEDYEVHLCS